MKTKIFKSTTIRQSLYIVLSVSLLLGRGVGGGLLFAQNGVTLSNYRAQAGPAGSSTLTIDIRWEPPADAKKVWSDTVWVFADYNNAGTMTRLPLAQGATLANPSWSGAKVIEEPGNSNGVWVVGDAGTSGVFSATVQLVATCTDARPCVPTGVCVYAINYLPEGRYTAYNQIHFTGTPPFYVTYKEGGNSVVQNSLAKPFTVPAGKTIASFTDASLAPGTLICKPPVVQTLTASAMSYCLGSPGVTLKLSGTEPGAVYQLYKDNAEHSVLTGTGSEVPFSGSFTKGAYSVSVVAGAFCGASMAGATEVKDEYPLPENPTTTGQSRCGGGAVTLSAGASGGATIDWYSASSGGTRLAQASGAYTTPSLSTNTTYYAEARNTATGCVSSGRTPVTATVNAVPTVTSTTPASRCGGGAVTLSAGASGGATIDWYNASSGGTRLAQASGAYTTPSLSTNTTYYAEARVAATGCVSSSRAVVTATVHLEYPGNPTVTAGSRCGTGSVQLSASSPGAVVDWYSEAKGGSVLPNGSGVNSFTTPSLTTTKTYYAEARIAATGCKSLSRTPVTATMQKHPAGSTADFTEFDPCPGYTPGDRASEWTLVDRREPNNVQSYKVRLMYDGRYWMVQDLKFGDKCVNKGSFWGSRDSDQTGSELTSIPGYPYGDCRNNVKSAAGFLYDWAAAIQKSGAYYNSKSNVGCSGTGASANACRGICPAGWHIPTGNTSGEFYVLHNAPGRLCYIGNDKCWNNKSPWEGVLGNSLLYDGPQYSQGYYAYYWSSTYYNSAYAYNLRFTGSGTNPGTSNNYAKYNGFSVRCVRNY
ncbi:MAG: hypothetical protein LBT49_06050 [Prevotellaceae bacterium]|jgi:uncharacterized protein (TIGR02145 family)|nr:hypothetical protein [Prevotellaceae bacterium]